jgi:hypothetical protein
MAAAAARRIMSSDARSIQVTPVDRLVGRRVVDSDGKSAGRIEEFRVEVRGADWLITEYVLGVAGLLERLNVGVSLVVGRSTKARVAAAGQMDISDPAHPRLLCRRTELSDA